jgi:hypothetical protein
LNINKTELEELLSSENKSHPKASLSLEGYFWRFFTRQEMKKILSHEEFVNLAIQKLRAANFKGIHSVFSGFNEAFKLYFEGENPVQITSKLAEDKKIVIRPAKRGVVLYLPGEAPQRTRGENALQKMGLL